VHLIVNGNDELVPRAEVDALWSAIPDNAKMSRILIKYSPHRTPQAVPKFAAAWIYETLTNAEIVRDGRDFIADPFTGKVDYKGGSLHLTPQK
jgi:hypothetical protein